MDIQNNEDIDKDMKKEIEYLHSTILLLQNILTFEMNKLNNQKKDLIESNREMWEDSAHYTADFEKLTEMNQYLQMVSSNKVDYESTKKGIEKYTKLLDSPYFGRIDFIEDENEENEKIYIGKGTIKDPKTNDIKVFDWRAPISSMFYRFEPGKAFYEAPFGKISGEVMLKRQYKVVESQLKFMFNCSVQIGDEILQEMLSRNSSPQMRAIIETIQKEQDIVIRDTENDLLIVQGSAGSGKTSIALHRIAFLLYEGLASKLNANNIMILSPSDAFSSYISHILPELGEKNVEQTTMERIVRGYVKEATQNSKLKFNGRNCQLETCISGIDGVDSVKYSKWVSFKSSSTFKTIIDRYLDLYKRRMIKFEDIYYNNKLIVSRQDLKSDFLNNKVGLPLEKMLRRIENRIYEAITSSSKERLKRIEKIVENKGGHEFNLKSYSRLLLMKNSRVISARIKKFTEIDVVSLYSNLFSNKTLFNQLSKGLELPEDINEIIKYIQKSFKENTVQYEDWTAIAYMKVLIYGSDSHLNIRQVVIDEVQDYYPIQFAIIKELYGSAKFTAVGDSAQMIEGDGDSLITDEMAKLLGKNHIIKITLKKSYRSSYEINEFAKKVSGNKIDSISYNRHEEEPEIILGKSGDELESLMLDRINKYRETGFETMAIITKTMEQARALYSKLKAKIEISLVRGEEEGSLDEIGKGLYIMPVYMAKGLEFDAVLVHDVNYHNYRTEIEQSILYVACTRALHRLSLYYCGEKTDFLEPQVVG